MTTKAVDVSEFRKIRKPGCGFAQLDFTPEQLEKLAVVMPSSDFSSKGIYDVVKGRWKFQVSEETIRKHRAGTCGCP